MQGRPVENNAIRHRREVKAGQWEASNPSAAKYAWSALALVTCPCHLPLLLAMLAGTSAGTMIGSHWLIASLALTVTFALSLGRALSMSRR